ncbi:MAG: hypothetical protein H7X95_13000 [Deltaproteobacteria bacterium]|nr:hypothetical protein [Deltaproteobacteria bacterium]
MMTDGASRSQVEIQVSLCAGGQTLNLSGRNFSIRVFRNAPVSGEFFYTMWNGGTLVFAGSDSTLPANANFWQTFSTPPPSEATAVTHIGLVFRAFVPWTGTVYVDDIRLN